MGRRRVFKLNIREIEFAEIKRGDLFVMTGMEDDSEEENGNIINYASTDADAEGDSILCKQVDMREALFTAVKIQPEKVDV